MSRHTEIETAAHHAYEDYLYENSQDFANGIKTGFTHGADWADKTMLNKVYEWIQDKQNDIEVIKYGPGNPINFHKATINELIEHFK